MKKKISVSMIAFLAHLIFCIFISFDWSFLEGMYMGFGPTFLIVWGLTLPIITACIAVVGVIIKVTSQEKLSVLETVTAVVGGIILLIYPASAIGLIKHFALGFVYVFVFVGMIFILGCWCYKKIKKK